MPAFSISGAPIASGSRPTSLWATRGAGRAVRLHADRVEHGVRAAAVGHLADGVGEVAVREVVEVDDLDAAVAHALRGAPARGRCRSRAVPAWAAMRAAMSPIGPRPTHAQRPAVRDVSAYLTPCHAVGSTSDRNRKRSSGGPVGHLDRQLVAERHAQELGLPAGHLPVELRVAEQRRAGARARGPASSRTATAGPGRT